MSNWFYLQERLRVTQMMMECHKANYIWLPEFYSVRYTVEAYRRCQSTISPWSRAGWNKIDRDAKRKWVNENV